MTLRSSWEIADRYSFHHLEVYEKDLVNPALAAAFEGKPARVSYF